MRFGRAYDRELAFAHDRDEAADGALRARGYRRGAYDTLKQAWPYVRRFHEREAACADPDKCQVVVWRFDLSDIPNYPADQDPVGYQVEVYVNTADGGSATLELYGFPGRQLLDRLPALEGHCLALWGMLSRRCGPEYESEF